MSTGATGGASFLGIGLRGAGTLSISSDRLVSAGVTYPTADIAWAGLVNDPAVPQGAPPLPAIAWRMANGQHVSATPAHPEEAWQVLEALFEFRPDLRTPLPPVPPPGASHQHAEGSLGTHAPNALARPNQSETVMAGLAHLSIFFGGLIVPFILWRVNRKKAPYAAEQASQAFYFHSGIGVALVVLGLIASSQTIPDEANATPAIGFVLWYVLLFAVYLFAVVYSIIGAVKAFNGQPFHYPLVGGA